MDLWLPFFAAVAVLAGVCIALLCNGLDPLRLLRSVFKVPRLHLTPSSASFAEKEALLANDRKARIRFRGKVPLYTDTIAELAECKSSKEVEEFIKLISMHRLLSSEIKAQHFAQFCRTKLDLKALHVNVIATIVASLQKFAAQSDVAQFLQQCFCAKEGFECLALKNAVERQVSIFRVVYQRIRSASVRDTILEHFEVQAYEITRRGNFVAPLKLVCDIDDTLLSVLFDTRYPELTVYPGVHQFVHEVQRLSLTPHDLEQQSLSRSGTGDDDSDEESQQKRTSKLIKEQRITFLTARPEILRQRSTKELRACGFTNFTLLMGSLTNVLGSRRIASGKLKNFTRFKRIFCEHRFIFVGDNGQGDIDLGKALLKNPSLYAVSAVLIHDVIRNHTPNHQQQQLIYQ
uniref:Phosphatidate phosphatase APP1 catalytic domain-containing protein n=1 Tax=Globisporangium ultimum (strain ATCC 200006 / CBS 805.95 / DAOM BR144) TaxID=431595 RepID=K3XAC5_GLOUD